MVLAGKLAAIYETNMKLNVGKNQKKPIKIQQKSNKNQEPKLLTKLV